MRVLLFVLTIFLLSGCGVHTDSSDGIASAPSSNIDDGTDSNDTDDTNTTDDDGDTDDGSSSGDQLNSDFDITDAIEDPNACIINGTYKNGMDDSSFDPEETFDSENGIAISSFLAYDASYAKTQVTVYYPDLGTTPSGNQIVITESKYRVGFDQKWPTSSNKTIYVRTPRYLDSNYYGCYRYTLSLDKSSIVAQKVYRIR
jgi:hypothetical protein